MKAERRLICAWTDRMSLVRELLGDGYEFGGNSPVHYPGKPNVVAVDLEVEPLADDVVRQDFADLTDGPNGYRGFAKITVKYELLASSPVASLAADAEPDALLTYRVDRETETVRLPGDELYWPGNPSAAFPTAAEGEVRMPATIHRLTWHRVVSPPWTAIRECQGALSAGEFLGVAAGQLIFDGVAAEREFVGLPDFDDPQFGWRLEYRFRENPLLSKSTSPIFRTADFTRLLKFEEFA
jgi:hypothetical protein